MEIVAQSHVVIATLLVIVIALVWMVWFAKPAMGGTQGQGHFVVRIDPAAAGRIRAWRRASGFAIGIGTAWRGRACIGAGHAYADVPRVRGREQRSSSAAARRG
ncbi:MAG TPA: hypothetical protein VFW82_05575 [Dyella sp.]|nr:hypothetical protein [Dyella sp.]